MVDSSGDANAIESTIRVADFSSHVSGATASLFLRAVGAEVTKIENPRFGDGTRVMRAAPSIGGYSIYHHSLNWGAKSVALDARSKEWPRWVEAFANWADVVLVGGRPRDARRLGLDLATIRRQNPRVVYCHISGYGSTGEWAERAAHGQNSDALSGLVDLVYDEHGPRSLPWRPAGTTFSGVIGALGILAALYHRSQTGIVLSIETSMWEAGVWWNWRQLTAEANLQEDWGRITDFGSRYAIYLTQDRRPLLIAPGEQKFWRTFCEVAGVPEMADAGDWSSHYDFGDPDPNSIERARLAKLVAMRPLREWIQALEPTDVPFCEVLTAPEVLESDHFLDRRMLLELEGTGGSVIRPPLILSDSNGVSVPLRTRLPGLGDHTDEFRQLFGFEQT